jgi:succinyl-CoA synthetase beta subunit
MTDMKLIEYKGEELLKDFGIPIKNGVVVAMRKMCLALSKN